MTVNQKTVLEVHIRSNYCVYESCYNLGLVDVIMVNQ